MPQAYAVVLGTLQIRSNVPIPIELKKIIIETFKSEIESASNVLRGPNGEEVEIRLIEVG